MSAELSGSMIPITINLWKRIDWSRTSSFLFRRMNINGQVCASNIHKKADNIPLVLVCLIWKLFNSKLEAKSILCRSPVVADGISANQVSSHQ
jgi:hypothetical protein